VRTLEIAYAPPANPAKIRVGFSGESWHPPWARAGIAAINANARAVRRKVFFIGRSYFRRDPGALGFKNAVESDALMTLALRMRVQDVRVYTSANNIRLGGGKSTILITVVVPWQASLVYNLQSKWGPTAPG